MNVFVARQPIFDKLKRVVAYELLFRSGFENFFSANDGDAASRTVMSGAVHIFGLASLTSGKPVFINFTRSLLLSKLAFVLPPTQLVVELLETVEPDDEVLNACKELRRHGYLIALDDFVLRPGYEPLISVADIVKVDFLQVKGEERKKVSQSLARSQVRLLAEKVETMDDFREAIQLGYTYFQGFFFSKPEIVSGREVPSHKLAHLRLIQELNQPELDFSAVEAILKSDLSLSLKLLRYINSAAIGLRYPVTSLRQAMVLLGEQNFRRWALLALTTSLLEDKPQELILTGVIRGRFCELICQKVGWRAIGVDPFLVGFLSVLDALLDQPLPQLLDELPIAPEIKDALSGRPTLLGFVYNLVIAYERADWERVSELIGKVGLPEGEVPLLYAEAVAWADTLLRQIPL
jgi:EAL and modified HD-GYP domain-containing signal transduction protein